MEFVGLRIHAQSIAFVCARALSPSHFAPLSRFFTATVLCSGYELDGCPALSSLFFLSFSSFLSFFFSLPFFPPFLPFPSSPFFSFFSFSILFSFPFSSSPSSALLFSFLFFRRLQLINLKVQRLGRCKKTDLAPA